MHYFLRTLFFSALLIFGFVSYSQDSAALNWNVTSTKLSNNEYELIFSTNGNSGWQLYAPNQVLSEVATSEIKFSDSAIKIINGFSDTGSIKNIKSPIFETGVKLYTGATTWKHTIKIEGTIPEKIIGSLIFLWKGR